MTSMPAVAAAWTILQRHPGRLAAQIGRHVDAAEEQRFDAVAGAGDLGRGFERFVGLDDDMQARRQLVFGQQVAEVADFLGSFDLGQHHRRNRRRRVQERLHVLHPLGRAQAVHADDALDAVRAFGCRQGREGGPSRLVLVLGGDGVFEIDANDVGPASQRLGEHVGAIAGGEDEAAPRADGAVVCGQGFDSSLTAERFNVSLARCRDSLADSRAYRCTASLFLDRNPCSHVL
jgi:hypothetical protein